jgi:hypothetical protein
VNKVKLSLAPRLEVEFADRESAIKQVEELAEKGTRFPIGRIWAGGLRKDRLVEAGNRAIEGARL